MEGTMSRKAVGEFVAAINASLDLQARCRKVLEGSSDAAGFAALGRESGFEFTEEDARIYFAIALTQPEPVELTDEDLANIAGGRGASELVADRLQSQDLLRSMGSLPRWALGGFGSPP